MYATQTLVELTGTLEGDSLRDACEHLTARAEHRSAYVKKKALKLIVKCCEGSSDRRFAREMAKISGRIRALQSHTGPPHPTKGDSVHAAVREAAKEAMSAIFGSHNDVPSSTTSVMSGGGRGSGRIEGFGDGGAARDAGTVGGRLMGRETSGIHSRSHSYEEHDVYNAPSSPLPKPGTLDAPLEASLNSTPKLNIDSDGPTKWKPLRPPSPKKKPEPVRASAPATGDLISDFATSTASASSPPSAPTASSPAKAPTSQEPEFVLDGSEEKRVVNKLCTPSGVRLAPKDGDVLDFLRHGARLNAQGVVIALSERLVEYASEEEWRHAYRAACVLETASKEVRSGTWLTDVFLNSSAMDLLEAIASDVSAQAQLKQKAIDAVAALRRGGAPSSVSATSTTTTATTTTPSTTASSPMDLLSQLGDLSVAAPPPAAPGASARADPLADLFAQPTSSTAPTDPLAASQARPPTAYVPPTAPMRGPGLAALAELPPTAEADRLKQTKAFDFVGDLMR